MPFLLLWSGWGSIPYLEMAGLVKGKRGSSQIQGLDNGGHDVINLRDDIRAMDTSKKLKE